MYFTLVFMVVTQKENIKTLKRVLHSSFSGNLVLY